MKQWKEYKLGEVINFKRGYDLPNSQRMKGKIPVISSAGITDYHAEFKKLGPGVITGRYGTIGKVFFVNEPYWPLNTTLYITDFKGNNPKFIYYFLQILNFEKYSDKSTVPGVNRNHLHLEEVKLPPLPEQCAIASVLSSLDDKIDLLHRQNATLEALAETLFRQWFVEEEHSNNLTQLIEIQNGYAFKSNDFKTGGIDGVVKIKNISGGVVDIENTDFIDESVASLTNEKFKIYSGDILIAMTGAEIGKLGIIPYTSKKLWLNQRVGLLKEKFMGGRFLAYLQLKSEFGQDYIFNTATGSAQPNISAIDIEKCAFPSLTAGQIKLYTDKIYPFYEKIIFNHGQIRTLTQLRDTLLPKLMSGEMRADF